MYPFDTYPSGENELKSRLRPADNCRRGYGLDLQKRTGQTRCAYCGVSLVDDYYHWLLMAVDHVVPIQQARKLVIPDELIGGLVNQVLCCSGCNGFRNRYAVADQPRDNWSLEEFIELRDRVFRDRTEVIAARRVAEMVAFDRKEWEALRRAA